ncbi:hypothetical protein J5N97_020648 [Dioscorea zingiberensis]|uniref:Growth-regulating factor n=1 Tax=Dioscorea zingiberensis TaxID=325984 RepID=A0A9D5CH03_9LILI|nr:hypothetical protein J5N97_020648 [Dioscorea zingiberensis]
MDMDMDSQQWGTQQESDHQQLQHQAKVPKLQLITDEQEIHASALPLFAAAPLISTRTTAHSLTPFPLDSTHTRFSWGGGIVGLFSLAQWQELELQALIYKYMLAGAPVPSELILPIKKSLLAAQPYYYQHHQLIHYQHLPTAMLQGGYWGRCAMDPEPGRCRRTDGKKWRCSREVVPGHKYCERHVHRGRNRSRKHVELATTTPTPSTPPTSKDITHFMTLNHRGKDGDNEICSKSFCSNHSSDQKDSHVLRKFFSERPRSQAVQHESITSTGTQTLLSISIPGNPPSSDVSLKLSTGGSLVSSKDNIGDGNGGGLHPKEPPSNAANHANLANNANHAGNWSGWGNGNHGEEGATGGPLAEALRSSISTASPTSVLQKTSGISASETSSISI